MSITIADAITKKWIKPSKMGIYDVWICTECYNPLCYSGHSYFFSCHCHDKDLVDFNEWCKTHPEIKQYGWKEDIRLSILALEVIEGRNLSTVENWEFVFQEHMKLKNKKEKSNGEALHL